MKTYLPLITLLFLMSFSSRLFAQNYPSDSTDTEQLFVIKRHDGVEYIGKILSDNAREILIETENLGQIYLMKSDIKSITMVLDKKSIINGEFLEEGPFTTRYTFTTNALPIKKGENYSMVNLYGPEVHFAMNDQFSLGVMSSWIVSPMILAGKYTLKTKNEKVNFSLGTLIGT